MELLNQFGFDPLLFGAQIVNFLILLYILRRFLYKPVLDLLQKRQKTIEEGLRQAEEARIRLEKAAEEEKSILKTAQAQAVKILEDSNKEGRNILQKSEAASKKQTEKMIAEARTQIQFEIDNARKQLSSKVSTLAVEMLEKALSDMMSKEYQKEFIDKAVKRLRV